MINSLNKIIAHRGESYDAPENSLAAINLAWSSGARAVEIDIQLTKDNKIVVFHDKNTKRITGEKLEIKKSNLAELSLLDIGICKGEKYKNERIPCLEEVLNTVPENAKLVIEIKSDSSILFELKNQLAASKLKDRQIEIIAFNFKTITRAKALMPNYKMLWLLDLDYYWPWWMVWVNTGRIVNKVKKYNLEGVNVWAGKILNKGFIKKFKLANLQVYTWTVNNSEQAADLFTCGIDGLTTDRANWMSKELIRIFKS